MFSSRSLIALLVLALVAASVSAHPSPGHLHQQHRRVHVRPRSVVKRKSCQAPGQLSFNGSSSVATIPTSVIVSPDSPETPSPSPSHTHSSAAPAEPKPTKESGPPSSENNAFAALAPLGGIESWSTSPSAPNPLPLDDATFRVTSLLKALAHPYVNAPDGQLSMKATYPKGSYNFQHQPLGGLSFYAPGPASVDLTTAKEVTFGYTVYFEEGFQFNKGGKLPGIYGGDSDETAKSCSGGRRDDKCMSARLMWRTDGMGEFYTYLPPSFPANDNVCDVKPMSTCNPTYGASVGRGSFYWKAGASTTVSMRARLNDVGKQNGELQLWANGESVINVGGLVLRDSAAGRFRGIQMQTFFGGSTADYASPQTQSTYFRDFTIAITEKL